MKNKHMYTFDGRTLVKSNFLMNKFGSNPKKYSKWGLYKRWIRERTPPIYPFEIEEIEQKNGSVISSSGIITQIRMSNRLKKTNLHGVKAIKEFMKKMTGKQDIVIDDLANFIAVYTFLIPDEQLQAKQNDKRLKSNNSNQKKTNTQNINQTYYDIDNNNIDNNNIDNNNIDTDNKDGIILEECDNWEDLA
jgi:hypothetical protein